MSSEIVAEWIWLPSGSPGLTKVVGGAGGPDVFGVNCRGGGELVKWILWSRAEEIHRRTGLRDSSSAGRRSLLTGVQVLEHFSTNN